MNTCSRSLRSLLRRFGKTIARRMGKPSWSVCKLPVSDGQHRQDFSITKSEGRFEFRNSDRGLRNRRAEGKGQKAEGSSPREITNQLSHGVKQEADGRRTA